jgi:hypothetical protein
MNRSDMLFILNNYGEQLQPNHKSEGEALNLFKIEEVNNNTTLLLSY